MSIKVMSPDLMGSWYISVYILTLSSKHYIRIHGIIICERNPNVIILIVIYHQTFSHLYWDILAHEAYAPWVIMSPALEKHVFTYNMFGLGLVFSMHEYPNPITQILMNPLLYFSMWIYNLKHCGCHWSSK